MGGNEKRVEIKKNKQIPERKRTERTPAKDFRRKRKHDESSKICSNISIITPKKVSPDKMPSCKLIVDKDNADELVKKDTKDDTKEKTKRETLKVDSVKTDAYKNKLKSDRDFLIKKGTTKSEEKIAKNMYEIFEASSPDTHNVEKNSAKEKDDFGLPPPPGPDDGKPLEPGTFRGIILWCLANPTYVPHAPQKIEPVAFSKNPVDMADLTTFMMPKDCKKEYRKEMKEKPNTEIINTPIAVPTTAPPTNTQNNANEIHDLKFESRQDSRQMDNLDNAQHEITDDEILCDAQYKFMLYLTEGWEKHNEGQLVNLVTSPMSLHSGLTMFLLGCKGATFESVKCILGLDTFDKDKIQKIYQKLLIELHNSAWSKECFIGNVLIASNLLKVNNSYNELLQNYFRNHIIQEDFTDIQLASKVNFWTKKNTNKRIDDVVKNIDKDYKLIALSAVYCEAVWQTAFDKKDTKVGTFFNADSTTTSVKLMTGVKRCKFNESKHGYVIFLPCKKKALHFGLYLPSEEVFTEAGSFTKIFKNLGVKGIKSLFCPNSRADLELMIPKFILESKHQNWKSILTHAGFHEIFETPDLSSMFNESDNVKLNNFMHTSVIKFDETGIHPSEHIPKTKNVTIKFDRPFLYLLLHRKTRTPIFLGHLFGPVVMNDGVSLGFQVAILHLLAFLLGVTFFLVRKRNLSSEYSKVMLTRKFVVSNQKNNSKSNK